MKDTFAKLRYELLSIVSEIFLFLDIEMRNHENEMKSF